MIVRALPLTNNVALVIAVGSPYVAVAAAVTLVFSLVARQVVLSLVAVVIVTANLAIQIPWYYFAKPVDIGAHVEIRVLSSNLRKGRADVPAFAELARTSADILMLSELTPDWVGHFYSLGIRKEFPYSLLVPAPDAGGFGMWSRFPLEAVSPLKGGSMIAAQMEVPGVRIDPVVAGLHIMNPLTYYGRASSTGVERLGGHMTAVNDRLDVSANIVSIPTKVPAWQRGYSRRLVAIDLVGVMLAVALAQWLRFGTLPGAEHVYQYWNYSLVSLAVALSWMAALSINHSRSVRIIGCGAEEYRRVWLATLAVFGGVAIISMLFKLEIARGYLVIALPAGICFLVLFRYAARLVVRRVRERRGRCITRVLVVGSASAVRDLTTSLAREPRSEYEVVGACIPGPVVRTKIDVPGVGEIPTFGDESNVVGAVTATNSHAVAVTATERLNGRGIRDLSWELEKLDIDLLVSPGVVDVAGPRLQMRPVAGLPLIHVEKPQYHGAKRFQKRLFDIVFSGSVLLFGLPVLIAVAIAVKFTSNGPIFYRQERIGLDGNPFEMIKFRTMVDGADKMVEKLAARNESEGGVLFKIRQDPRVTPVGRILRKYSIDELPQFINVLKRDMSVVGPRPPLAKEVKSYDDFTKRRLLVRPGITGLWQVSGRSDLSWEDSVRLDMFYVENWSMISDLLIALKTVKAMVGHSGAY